MIKALVKLEHEILCKDKEVMIKFDKDRMYVECQKCHYESKGIEVKNGNKNRRA